jgi:hypothetical protein
VDYLTDEQRSYGDKEPVELGADLQFGPLAVSSQKTLVVLVPSSLFFSVNAQHRRKKMAKRE